jgi:hypothetical protein
MKDVINISTIYSIKKGVGSDTERNRFDIDSRWYSINGLGMG